MPANISLDSVSAVSPTQLQTKPDSTTGATAAASAAAVATASPKLANPRLTVDPSLNRVVLEFFSSSGVLTNSIPSQSQLQAYRLAAFSGSPVNAADKTGSA